MYSPSQKKHPHDDLSGKDHQSLTKSCAVSRRICLYPSMHRDRAYANESSISTHEHPTWSKTQSPLQFVDQGPTPPAKQPARYMVSNMMHLSLLPNHNKELTLSPPAIRRISSSPIPLRYECIGDPALKIFRLSLPRELVRRLDGIIALSEQFAQGLAGGWKTELYSLTKQDLPLRDIPGMALLICPIFDYIIQAIQVLYGCRRVIVDKNQPHILKYSLDTQHTGGEWQEQMHGMTVVDPNREFLMKNFSDKETIGIYWHSQNKHSPAPP